MRKLEIKHPDYGKFGRLEQYGVRYLTQEKEMGKRVDFYPNVKPVVPIQTGKPDPKHVEEVTKKSLEILSKMFVDGVPLTDLYDWEMNISSANAGGHGWGTPNWRYYMVGMLKKPGTLKPQELKEMVTEAVLAVMNKRI